MQIEPRAGNLCPASGGLAECHCPEQPPEEVFASALSQVSQLYLPRPLSSSSCSHGRCVVLTMQAADPFSIEWGPHCDLHTGASFLVEGRGRYWSAAHSAVAPSLASFLGPHITLPSIY